jgi:hypothetical protein
MPVVAAIGISLVIAAALCCVAAKLTTFLQKLLNRSENSPEFLDKNL